MDKSEQSGPKQMLSDLTPQEIIGLVYAMQALPENAMVANENNELTLLIDLPGLVSFANKLNEAGKRDDVKEYIDRISKR